MFKVKITISFVGLVAILWLLLLSSTRSHAQTTVSGNISGTWSKVKSPYLVIDNCTVPDKSILTIEPGVTVFIGESLSIKVLGQIKAIGTPDEHIVIRSPNENVYWNQIYIQHNPPNGTSKFVYCVFSGAQTAIYMKIGYPFEDTMSTTIKNCNFTKCKAYAIYGESHGNVYSSYSSHSYNPHLDPIIENCRFSSVRTGCSFWIHGEIVTWPMGWIAGYGHASPKIRNNVFALTDSALVLYRGNKYAGNSYPVFVNNNVLNGCRGVYSEDPFYPEIRNNIFLSDSIGVQRTGTTTTQVAFNCFFDNEVNFKGFPSSYGSIVMQNQNGDPCDVAFNIFMDPSFADSTGLNLTALSPCIDAGDPNPSFSDICFPPSQRTTTNDIGALGGPGACGWIATLYRPPSPPRLISPDSGAIDQPKTLTLLWHSVVDAASYGVQVSTEPSFVQGLVINDSTVLDTFKVVTGLASDTKYYWRVNAKNVYGKGPWSLIWAVTVLNEPPFVKKNIPDVIFAEDTSPHTVITNLDSNFSDPDGNLTYKAYSDNTNIQASIQSKSLIANSSLNYFGSGYVRVTATDNGSKSVSDTFLVQITPVNDVPKLNLPDSIAFRNDSYVAINLWEYASDVETPDSLLSYTCHHSNTTFLITDYNKKTGELTLSTPGYVGSCHLYVSVADDSNATAHDTVKVIVESPVGVDERVDQNPTKYELYQNSPNPFNPITTIRFDLPKTSFVTLKVYNLLGHEVAALVSEKKIAGTYAVEFDASLLSSGVYFYRLETDGGLVMTKKLLFLK